MNYKKIYFNIIRNRQNNPLPLDVYGENHHIIPRSFGGNDNPENLVRLSAREHFIVHFLLVKIFHYLKNKINSNRQAECYKKMLAAFFFMQSKNKNQQNRYFKINSKVYSKLKLELYNTQRKYDFNLIKSIFDYYASNNLKPTDIEHINQKFDINVSHSYLMSLFSKFKLKLSDTDFQMPHYQVQYSYNQIKSMFDFYIEHQCSKQENYHLIEKQFGYKYSKKQLTKLFNRNGFYVENKVGKFGKHSKQTIKSMFDFYIQYQCNKKENYHLIKQKFGYEYESALLTKLFNRHGLFLSKIKINNGC